ncbi:hypothetical protein APHAL10511_000578 [Amanita phalloides]|nr:hypothetical protein APHAL10511_000578 [Amanita phalloides]
MHLVGDDDSTSGSTIVLFTRKDMEEPTTDLQYVCNHDGTNVGGSGNWLTLLLDPLGIPSKLLSVAFIILVFSSPLFVESILLIRLWRVYPFRTTPRKIFIAILASVALLKFARLANMTVFLVVVLSIKGDGLESLWILRQKAAKTPSCKLEWLLQVVDNTSASGLFLMKLNEGRAFKSKACGWSSRLEGLFWITVSNFIIPVVMSVVQLVVAWTSQDIFDASPICIVNIYVEIIGVLLATVWAAGVGVRYHEEGKITTAPTLTTMVSDDRGYDL